MSINLNKNHKERVLTVSQLNRIVTQLLRTSIGKVWVTGEISNFTQAASGHWYFSIKDDNALIRAVMFRSRSIPLGFIPKEGDKLDFYGSVGLYEPRGDFQLQVDIMRRAGRGNLYEQFLQLKEKLEQEGLFTADAKKTINQYPKVIGVISSTKAAALQDVISTLKRRAPHVKIIVYPSPVQGGRAAFGITSAISSAVSHNVAETLLLVRGGGSIEDLWCFNDESVARAIFNCPIPVISGVGHETDFTIADFVADLRAPTPTAAAELVCKSRADCVDELLSLKKDLNDVFIDIIDKAAMRLDRSMLKLVSPLDRVKRQRDELYFFKNRMYSAMQSAYMQSCNQFNLISGELSYRLPNVAEHSKRVDNLHRRLDSTVNANKSNLQHDLARLYNVLKSLNPRRVLGRGYAIVKSKNKGVVTSSLDLTQGEVLDVEFKQGSARVTVTDLSSLL